MNWIGFLVLLPMALVGYIFFNSKTGYPAFTGKGQELSNPEFRFSYTAETLQEYFESIGDHSGLRRLWCWKIPASLVISGVMVYLCHTLMIPRFLFIPMSCAAGVRCVLAIIETILLFALQKRFLNSEPLFAAKPASVMTSLKWIFSGIYLLGLFGFLLIRGFKTFS